MRYDPVRQLEMERTIMSNTATITAPTTQELNSDEAPTTRVQGSKPAIQFVVGWSPEYFCGKNGLEGDPRGESNMKAYREAQAEAFKHTLIRKNLLKVKTTTVFSAKYGYELRHAATYADDSKPTVEQAEVCFRKSKAQSDKRLMAMASAIGQLDE